jgi:HAD superfamily hydrolase (TIGR01509 family)
MGSMPSRAIIFDCDGVLVDSEPQANRVLSAALAERGVDMSPDECRAAFVGLNPRGVAGRLIELRGIDLTAYLTSAVVPRFMALLEAEGLAPMPGALDAVRSLHDRGVPIAVASNSPLPELQLKLRLTGLDRYFGPHVHSGDAIGRSKPDPGVYLHAAAGLGMPPEACTVIEDTPTGVLAAARAGMRVIGFSPGHGGEEALRAAGAGVIMRSLVGVADSLGLAAR